MKSFFKNNYYLLTSLLFFLSFPSYDFWLFKGFPFIAWFALVPVFIYVRNVSFKRVFTVSFGAGFFANLFAYHWIGHFGDSVEGGYYVILAFLIPTLAFFFVMRIFIAEFLARRFEKLRVVIYPSVWILFDWIQSAGFLAFPWTNWGYSQYPFTAFIQTASVTGILGINFIMILFNVLAADFILHKKEESTPLKDMLHSVQGKRIAGFIILFILIVTAGAFSIKEKNLSSDEKLRVSVVQSCISPWDNWNRNKMAFLEELKNLTLKAMEDNPDFVIWSESATLETISYDYETCMLNRFEKELFDFVKNNIRKPLLTGEIGVEEDLSGFNVRRYPQNSAVMISANGEVLTTYPKINLVPFGEWFPYAKWFPSVKRLAASMGGSSFVPGDKPVMFNLKDLNFGVLICYEGIFYRLCREYSKMGASMLVNITNDGWTDTYNGHMQHFSASVFRAVENGLWLVRAGNTGYTVALDPYGRIDSSIPILRKGYLTADIDFTLNRSTIYSKTGDVILFPVFVLILILVVIILKAGLVKNGNN